MSNKQTIEALKRMIKDTEESTHLTSNTKYERKCAFSSALDDIEDLPDDRYQIAKEVLTEFAREISQKPEKAMQLVNITYELGQWLEEKLI